jgi:GNAT superfamily N-acetyltransferase
MNVAKLTRADQPELIAMLRAAFYDYPVMRFVLQKSTANEYERHLDALIEFFCAIRFVRNFPALGIRSNGQIVAAALMNEPTSGPRPLPMSELERLRSIIGEEADGRLVQYETQSSIPEPAAPHHLLGMIGVHPAHRGKRYAGVLLQAVQEIAVKDPSSTGVFLNTEDPANVPFYEHFGYQVIGEVDIGNLHSWCFFLPVR